MLLPITLDISLSLGSSKGTHHSNAQYAETDSMHIDCKEDREQGRCSNCFMRMYRNGTISVIVSHMRTS
jgi:hypothetical protein